MLSTEQNTLNLTEAKEREPAGMAEARKKLRWLINDAKCAVKLMITPAMAAVMMERNASDEWKNRPTSKRTFVRYVRAMKAGWKYTGETIIFSKSGNLLNGQHRLFAAMAANVGFPCLVVFGVDDDAFKFIDVGCPRTAGHIFAIEGILNFNNAAAVARLLYGYLNIKGWDGTAPVMENDDLLSFYYEHKDIQESIVWGRRIQRSGLMPGRWAGFCHYICASHNRSEADEFFDGIAEGANLVRASALFNLRKRLEKESQATQASVGEVHLAAYTIKAWNASRRNVLMEKFFWRPEKNPNEPFPRAQ